MWESMFCGGGGGRFSGSSYIPACWLKNRTVPTGPPRARFHIATERTAFPPNIRPLSQTTVPLACGPVLNSIRWSSQPHTSPCMQWETSTDLCLALVHFININHPSPNFKTILHKQSRSLYRITEQNHRVGSLSIQYINHYLFQYWLDRDHWLSYWGHAFAGWYHLFV